MSLIKILGLHRFSWRSETALTRGSRLGISGNGLAFVLQETSLLPPFLISFFHLDIQMCDLVECSPVTEAKWTLRYRPSIIRNADQKAYPGPNGREGTQDMPATPTHINFWVQKSVLFSQNLSDWYSICLLYKLHNYVWY